MVCSFCEKLQWVSLAAALGSIKPRLHFGVPFELVSLMEVEGISPNRARALVSGGFKTIEKIAHASPIDIAVALTRDVTVEGTQMTRSATAERILNVTSKLIIDNARIKLGLSEILPIATISEDISGLLSPISAPEFIQEILGTQWEENFGELSLSSFTDGEDELLLAIDQPNAVPKNQIQQSPFPTRSPYPMGTPLNAHDDDDRFLLEAFESIEARISTLPPRRRISEMTTIDVRPSKKIKRVSENVPKFILPTKTMMANDDQNFSLNS
jgi:hypothetical protein